VASISSSVIQPAHHGVGARGAFKVGDRAAHEQLRITGRFQLARRDAARALDLEGVIEEVAAGGERHENNDCSMSHWFASQ